MSIGRLDLYEIGVCDEDDDPAENAGKAVQDIYGPKNLQLQLPEFGRDNAVEIPVSVDLCDFGDNPGPHVSGDVILNFGKKGAVTAVWRNSDGRRSLTCSSKLQVRSYEEGGMVKAEIWFYFDYDCLETNIFFAFEVTIPSRDDVSASEVGIELVDTLYDF